MRCLGTGAPESQTTARKSAEVLNPGLPSGTLAKHAPGTTGLGRQLAARTLLCSSLGGAGPAHPLVVITNGNISRTPPPLPRRTVLIARS